MKKTILNVLMCVSIFFAGCANLKSIVSQQPEYTGNS